MFSTGERISPNRAAFFTCRGFTDAVYAVALMASTLPFRSRMRPRSGETTLSLVHWAWALRWRLSPAITCK